MDTTAILDKQNFDPFNPFDAFEMMEGRHNENRYERAYFYNLNEKKDMQVFNVTI